MTTQVPEKGQVPRIDAIDVGLLLWAVGFGWIVRHADPPYAFIPSYALVFLFVALVLWRRQAVPELRRPLQCLGVVSLCLASASQLMAVSIPDLTLRIGGPIFFFYSAFYAGLAFVSRSFGLSASSALQDHNLRPLFRFPNFAALTVGMGEAAVLAAWYESATWRDPNIVLAISSMWLIAFALTWVYLRRLASPVALAYLDNATCW